MTIRAGGNRHLWNTVKLLLPQIQQRLVLNIEDLKVYLVNGMLIRNHIFIDFTEGGNSQAYIWMPIKTIWLDHDIADIERKWVLLHELHEYNKMQKGMSYEPAHASANIVEHQARINPGITSHLFNIESRIYRNNNDIKSNNYR
jgi:hypothetical protein